MEIAKGRFFIDGYDTYTAFKVVVKSADGLDIVPKIKERDKHDWADESGLEVSTATNMVYDATSITLSCICIESTYVDAVKRINGLINLLSGNGYHLLGSTLRGRLFPVLLSEISSYKRVNSVKSSEVGVEFTVKLLCPLPECRMGSATVAASGSVSLNANTGKQVTVWWGDGTTTTGTGALNHTYTNAGTYTILIAGTGVTKSVFTNTVITIDEYSYPASGDVQNIDVTHTSEQAWSAIQAHINNLSPEYNDPKISTLKSVADGGIIPNAEATWLGATAKSILSYLQKLVSNVHYISNRVTDVESVSSSNTSTLSNILANFTAWVRGTLLTGLPTLSDVAIAVEDTVLGSFAKLQGQINAVKVRLGLVENKLIIDYTATVPITSLDITTFADGSPLLLEDGDVVEIETITYSATPLGLLIALNNNKASGQYQGGASLASITIVTAPFARCNVMLFVKKDQCIALTNTHRSSGGASTIVASTAIYVTKNTNDGGVIQTPITAINFWGSTLNAGSRICIKKIR